MDRKNILHFNSGDEHLKIGYFNCTNAVRKTNTFEYAVVPFGLDVLREDHFGEIKFVQLLTSNQHYLRLDFAEHRYGLENALNEFGLAFKTKEVYGGGTKPLPKGEKYELVGAGKAYIDNGYLVFGGDSAGYGIGPNEEALKIIGLESHVGVFDTHRDLRLFGPALVAFDLDGIN